MKVLSSKYHFGSTQSALHSVKRMLQMKVIHNAVIVELRYGTTVSRDPERTACNDLATTFTTGSPSWSITNCVFVHHFLVQAA